MKATLRGPDRLYQPDPIDAAMHPFVDKVGFSGPFPENSRLQLELPKGIADESGRPLANGNEFPREVATGENRDKASLAPMRFPHPREHLEVVESKAGGVLPVWLRNVGPQLAGRRYKLPAAPGATTPADEDIIAWLDKVGTLMTGGKPDEKRSSLLAPLPQAQAFTLADGRAPDVPVVAGIALREPGFYVVELESAKLAAYRQRLQQPFLATTALVTNLAVHFKRGRESSLVWVTTLDRAEPVAGAQVAVRDRCGGSLLWQGHTDGRGIAYIGKGQMPKASNCGAFGYFVSARSGDDLGFAAGEPSGDGYQAKLSRILGSSATARAGLIRHTVLDRPLFRPGETVSMKHYLRRHTMAGLEKPDPGQRATLFLLHEGSGETAARLAVAFDGRGNAESRWTLPKNAKLGLYTLSWSDADGPSGYPAGEFEVAEFRLPSMAVKLDLPEAGVVSGAAAAIGISAAYLNGGSAAQVPVTLRTILRPSYGDDPPDGYQAFSFGGEAIREGADPDQSAAAEVPLPSQSVTLGAAGTARVVLADLPKVDSPHEVAVELDYRDGQGEWRTVSGTFPLRPAQLRLGLKVDAQPAADGRRGVAVLALDRLGKPVSGQAVAVDVLRRIHNPVRRYMPGGFHRTDTERRNEKLGEICAGRTDAQGLLHCTVSQPAAGESLTLRAHGADGSGRTAWTTYPIWRWDPPLYPAESASPEEPLPVSSTEFLALFARDYSEEGGKADYEAGATARLKMETPFAAATALVTVEREGVMDYFVTRISRDAPYIQLPVKSSYAPNVHVSVLALRGRTAEDGPPGAFADPGQPAYRYRIFPLKVDWTPHRLEVRVTPDADTYRVRGKAKVRLAVRRADGRPPPAGAEVALAAVDEALLELVPNPSWQLLDEMMQSRAREITTFTAQQNVAGLRRLGAVGEKNPGETDPMAKLDRLFKKSMLKGGGDSDSTPPRELFDTLLAWRGRVALDRRGEAVVEVPLNDSLSAFRIVAVADAGGDAFGTGEATIRTAQDLAVYAGLPPVAREGDREDAAFTLRNSSGRPLGLEVKAAWTASGGGKPVALPPQNLRLESGETREVAWPVTVPAGSDRLLWDVEVRESGGKPLDRLRTTQQVVPVHAVQTYQATLVQLDRPVRLDIQRPAEADPQRGGIRVDLSPHLAGQVGGVADYMGKYPYSCLEQRLSKAVALRDRAQWDSIQEDLPKYADDHGLLRYFPDTREKGSEVLTAYVLATAHEAGWPLPAKAFASMADGLDSVARGMSPGSSDLPRADDSLRRLSAIEALSRYGKADVRMLRNLDVDPRLWPTSAVLDWLNVLQRVKDVDDRAARLVEVKGILRSRLSFHGSGVGFSSEATDRQWWRMVSPDFNAVRTVLSLLGEADWRQDLPLMMRGVLSRQRGGHWDTTPANAWGVLAMEKFAAAFEALPVSGSTEARLEGHRQRIKLAKAAVSLNFPWAAQRRELSVVQRGAGSPWANIRSLAAIPVRQPFSAGYTLQRSVTPVVQKQPGRWSRGDVAQVTLAVVAQTDMSWVVIDDPIPAGATILGSGLGGDSQVLAGERKSWPSYEERHFTGLRAYYGFMPEGTTTLQYTLRLNSAGRFELPPTHVEALYLPEMFGNLPNAPMEILP